MQSLGPLSEDFARFFRAVSSLPPSDPELSQLLLHDPGKRQWEISRTGYLNWAAAQLMNRVRVRSGASGVSARVDRVVGDPEDIRAALEEAQMNDTRDH
jgi:kinetochore protein Mis12/MTW1